MPQPDGSRCVVSKLHASGDRDGERRMEGREGLDETGSAAAADPVLIG